MIHHPAAYSAAVKRNIIENARTTWRRTCERADEVENFLYYEANRSSPFQLWVDFSRSLDTYGKLSEKQVACVLKAVDKQAAKRAQWQAERSNSKHVGEVGDRLESVVTVERVTPVGITPAHYYAPAVMDIITMRDENGNAIIWKTTSNHGLERGQTLTLRGTVKAHNTWNNEAQTILTRCKEIENV